MIYFMTTVFEVRGGKVNTMIPINRINRMEIKLIRNIITDAKKRLICINFWDNTSIPTSPTKDSMGFTTHMILK